MGSFQLRRPGTARMLHSAKKPPLSPATVKARAATQIAAAGMAAVVSNQLFSPAPSPAPAQPLPAVPLSGDEDNDDDEENRMGVCLGQASEQERRTTPMLQRPTPGMQAGLFDPSQPSTLAMMSTDHLTGHEHTPTWAMGVSILHADI